MTPALVLTAGLATRLRPLSFVRAKAAMPVAGEPLVQRILRALAAAGVTDAVLNLHHLPHTLASVVGDGSDLGVRIRYSWESPVLGSAGGPRHALGLLTSSPFLIVNGDTLTDVDLGALVADHRQSGALVTMAVVPNLAPELYGGVLVDSDGAVTGFTRRVSPTSAPSHAGAPAPSHAASITQPSPYHFVGVQVAQADAFASLDDGIPYDSVGALYPALIREHPGSVRAHVCASEFLEVGTPGDYLRASLWLVERQEHRGPSHGARVRIDSTARVERSVLWDDVKVGPGTMLRDCIVTDGVHVPAHTSWVGVIMRVATGELAPGERKIDGLAIASI